MTAPEQPPELPCEQLPVFLNKRSGSIDRLSDRLAGHPQIRLSIMGAEQIAKAILPLVRKGTPRIAVGGGDGTVALAASLTARTATQLAVLPGGTLNHFASRYHIPTDPEQALQLALHGKVQSVPVGYVNNQLFVNTSSVGAYVQFVRTRNFLRRRMSYPSASLLAGIRRIVRLRNARINLNGRHLHTPLIFIGVGERNLQFPALGQVKSIGSEGLHMIAVTTTGKAETIKMAFNAIFRGIDPLKKAEQIENHLLKSIEINYKNMDRHVTIAVDGELLKLRAPLHYRFAASDLNVVVP